jgi:hypothetical protein
MPYYVYEITPGPTELMKNLELREQYDAYREARNYARNRRAELEAGSKIQVKMIFAASQLEAEEKLLEVREKPILMEWEK